MRNFLISVLVGLCLFFFVNCEHRPTSEQETQYQFTINGVLVKDMNQPYDIVQFVVLRDSVAYDSAIVVVDDDTIPSYFLSGYYIDYYNLEAGLSHTVTISCPNHSFELTKNIIMPDTFHITDIVPNTPNPSGDSRVIYWSGSDFASGYFVNVVNVSDARAVGHSSLVGYNFRQETIPDTTFRNSSQTLVIPGTYYVYVVAYRESFLPYLDTPLELPGGLPEGNLDGANGTIGAGVIAPKDSIEVTYL